MAEKPIFKEVKFEATPRCNQSCEFCINKLSFAKIGRPGRNDDPLSTQQCLSILDNLADSKVESVRFTGGEFLLRNDSEVLVKYAKMRGLKVILTTNGSAFSADSLQLAKKYADQVLFSIHECTPKEDAKVTGLAGGFERKVSAIKELSDAGVFVSANTLGTKKRIARLEQYAELMNKLGIAYWYISFPVPTDKKLFMQNKEEAKIIIDLLERHRREGRVFKIDGAIPFCASDPKTVRGLLLGKTQCGKYTVPVIDPWGDVMPCHASSQKIGSALSQNLRELWSESPIIREFESTERLPPVCQACKFVSECNGGCRIYAQFASGDFHGMDPRANPVNLK